MRVLPEQGSFAPEAFAHRVVAARGVRVPQIMHWEHQNALLGRSVMVTDEMPGRALDPQTDALTLDAMLRAAGRDLARANSVAVTGWGWIEREPGTLGLSAPYPNARAWLADGFAERMTALRRHAVFDAATLDAIATSIRRYDGLFDDDAPCLAHGDFDPSHIFIHQGSYAGIIDWGEIRGAQPFYDLGHFAMTNAALLPALLAGYAEITALPPTIDQRIHLTSLLIALERTGGGLLRRPERPPFQPYVAAVLRALAALHA